MSRAPHVESTHLSWQQPKCFTDKVCPASQDGKNGLSSLFIQKCIHMILVVWTQTQHTHRYRNNRQRNGHHVSSERKCYSMNSVVAFDKRCQQYLTLNRTKVRNPFLFNMTLLICLLTSSSKKPWSSCCDALFSIIAMTGNSRISK